LQSQLDLQQQEKEKQNQQFQQEVNDLKHQVEKKSIEKN